MAYHYTSELNINDLPEEVLMHVLMFVPPKDVVKQCSLVCKSWLALSRDQLFWKRKCRQEGKYVPDIMGLTAQKLMLIYFKNPYGRNLLRNTHADSLQFWHTTSGRRPYQHMLEYLSRHRNAPVVETTLEGAYPIEDYIPPEELQGQPIKNWVTSHWFASMSQRVDLLAEGVTEEILDDHRPSLYASVWHAARWDCGSTFKLEIKLLDKDGRVVDSVQKEITLVDDAVLQIWHKMEHTFTNYKPGVRSVDFCMGGIDKKCWAGWYGAKFTLPCLRFVFGRKDEEEKGDE